MVSNQSQTISLQSVTYQLNNQALVKQITAEFQSGQISVVLGKNGAGKSTLLSLLSKEISPTSGEITWHNTALSQLSYAQLAQQRAVLPQLQSLVFSFSVQQLVELGAEVQPLSSQEEIKQISQKVMEICDVSHLANRDVITLSGGEQKRAQLARVLAQIWPVQSFNKGVKLPFLGRWLLLDEWTNSLDLHHQQTLAKHFKEWVKQGLGIVMVLHDINLCAQLADQVLLLNQAQLVQQGAPDDVLQVNTIYKELALQVRVLNIDDISHPIILPID